MVAIVTHASAPKPARSYGRYRYCAVLDVPYWLASEFEAGRWAPTMISARARGVYRVLRTYRRAFEGSTDRCAFAIQLREAHAWALAFNSAGDQAEAEQLIGAGGSA